MYETTYGTDWDQPDATDAYERAYATGIAKTLGYDLRVEYRRISESFLSTYIRSLVELAFQEGVKEARNASVNVTIEAEPIWKILVTEP